MASEVFQWNGADVSNEGKQEKIKEELADVVNYCVLMADACGLDLDEIVWEKIKVNAKKYPVEKAKKFNDKGWRTLVLSGSDSEEARAVAIERLAGEEFEDALDYIISVDIFSEGVDVPEINQVIMLRPTESPIVFIQQLGRGLRKAENKEYVVVLDFIGNYRNNFMIPIALSGDRSYNKDNIRRYVTEGGRVIPGGEHDSLR